MKTLVLLSAILICVVKLCDTTATSEHFVCKDELGNCIIIPLSGLDVEKWEAFIRATRSQECGLHDLTANGPFLMINSFYDKSHTFICKQNARLKREASNFRRGHYRGQTQSQYLNIENGSGNKDEGKAEAHSSSEGSRAIVSGRSGMGQAQSQSVYDPSCDECLSGDDMMRPKQNIPPELVGTSNLGSIPQTTVPAINSINGNSDPYRPETAYHDYVPGVSHQQVGSPGWQGSITNAGTPLGSQNFPTDFQGIQSPGMISGQPGSPSASGNAKPEYYDQGAISTPGLVGRPGVSFPGRQDTPGYQSQGTIQPNIGMGGLPGETTSGGRVIPGYHGTAPSLGLGNQPGIPISSGHLIPGQNGQETASTPGLGGQPGISTPVSPVNQGYYGQGTIPNSGLGGQPGISTPGGPTASGFQTPNTMPTSPKGGQQGVATPGSHARPGYHSQGTVPSPGFGGQPGDLTFGGHTVPGYHGQGAISGPSLGGQPGTISPGQHTSPGFGYVPSSIQGVQAGVPTSVGHTLPEYYGQGRVSGPGLSIPPGELTQPGFGTLGFPNQGTTLSSGVSGQPGQPSSDGHGTPFYSNQGTNPYSGTGGQTGVQVPGLQATPGNHGQGTIPSQGYGQRPGEPISGAPSMPGYNNQGQIPTNGLSGQPGMPTSGGHATPDYTNRDRSPSSEVGRPPGMLVQGGYGTPGYPNQGGISGTGSNGQPGIFSQPGVQKPATMPSSFVGGQTIVPSSGKPGYGDGFMNPDTQYTNIGTGMPAGFAHQQNNGGIHNAGPNGANWPSPNIQTAGPVTQQSLPSPGYGQQNGYQPTSGQGSTYLPQIPQIGSNLNNFNNGANQIPGSPTSGSNQIGTVPQSQRGINMGTYYEPTGSNGAITSVLPGAAQTLTPNNYYPKNNLGSDQYGTNPQNTGGGAFSPQSGTNMNGQTGGNNQYANGYNGELGSKPQGGNNIRLDQGRGIQAPGTQSVQNNFLDPTRYPAGQTQIGSVTENNGAVPRGEPVNVPGGEYLPPTEVLNKDYDDETQALANIIKASNGTTASASSKGGQNKQIAQTQVSGTYTGGGTFDAQAQISDDSKGAQSHVNGNKHGASSSAQGHGRKSKSQAKVELGSETGALITEAQSDSGHISTNTQVQGSVKGGTADAQAHGPGSTSSQAQIGFTPYKEGDKNNENMNSPFYGQGMASSNTGGKAGQSQAQLQGTFKYGISYHGASQAGSSLDKDAVFTDRIPFERLNVFDEKDKYINSTDDDSLKNAETPDENQNLNAQSKKNSESINYAHTHEEHHKNDQPNEEKRRSFEYARREPGGDINEKEDIPQEDYDNDNGDGDDADTDFHYDREDEQPSPDSLSLKGLEVKQSTGGSTQHIVLPPLSKHDAEITQSTSYGRNFDDKHIYQPGETVPHSNGYTIPAGFTGMIKSVASKDRTYAVGSRHAPAQAQTVSIKPGDGRIKYSKTIPGKDLRSLYPARNSDYEKHPFVSYSKSITGDFDANNNMKKQYSHTYYTKASSCGYFTFTCNIVDNGRRKVCTPKMPTNPDGTPMKC